MNENIYDLVKDMTQRGEWLLDAGQLKSLKHFCKQSNEHIYAVYDSIMIQLKKKHAQIRYSSLQLIEQLFERSKYFRDLITDDFHEFIQLTVGIQDKKLPPPVQVANKLREYAIALIKKWLIDYGDRYRQISIGYDYLLIEGVLDNHTQTLQHIHSNDHVQSNDSARIRHVHTNRYDLLKIDIEENLDSITDNLEKMEGCFEILIPKNEMMHDDIDFNALMRGEASYHQKRDEEYKDSIVSHGLGSNRYQITIDLSEEAMMEEVKETDDNKVIFDQIREAYTILETKHLKQLNDWINALMRFNIENKSEKDEITKRLLHLKSKANEEVRKAKMLGIRALPRRIPMTAIDYEEDEDYGNEEFEPVDLPSNRKEEVKVESIKLPPLQRIFPLSYEPTMSEDATYAGPLLHENKVHVVPNKNGKGKEKVDEQKEELLKRAPVVEWGEDLYYWDKKNVPFNTSGIEKSHRFMGVGEGDNEMPDQLLDELRKRPIYYESKYPTELRACNHPLHNGGLCPRKDLVTCPFHGRIIPRDELGRPLNPDDIKQSTSSSTGETSEGKKKPDKEVMDNLWELLESDVMAQTGNKLIQPKKKKKEKEKSSLIDIRKKPSTPYARLEQKVSSSKMKKAIDEAIEYERAIKSRNRDASRWK